MKRALRITYSLVRRRYLLHKLLLLLAIFTALPVVGAHTNSNTGNWEEKTHYISPQSCDEQAIATVNIIRNLGHNASAQQSFRLAVLTGSVRRVSELHDTFPAQAVTESKIWGNRQQRLETLQIALDDASATNQPAMIKQLIKYGASPNFITQWPTIPAIMVAADCGNVNAMDTLYKFGADLSLPAFNNPPSNAPRDAIEDAVFDRQSRSVVWLIHHGVRVCSAYKSKRINWLLKSTYGKGRLNDEALRALSCKGNSTR